MCANWRTLRAVSTDVLGYTAAQTSITASSISDASEIAEFRSSKALVLVVLSFLNKFLNVTTVDGFEILELSGNSPRYERGETEKLVSDFDAEPNEKFSTAIRLLEAWTLPEVGLTIFLAVERKESENLEAVR